MFLLNVISPDTLSTAGARLLDTLIGGALGLIVFALWPTWSEAPARDALAELVDAQRAYLSDVLRAYTIGIRPPSDEIRLVSRRLRLARVNAESTVARSLSEPTARRIDPERAQGALATVLRMTQATHVLRLEAQEHEPPPPSPGWPASPRRSTRGWRPSSRRCGRARGHPRTNCPTCAPPTTR